MGEYTMKKCLALILCFAVMLGIAPMVRAADHSSEIVLKMLAQIVAA